MVAERLFLGENEPFLPSLAAWLRTRDWGGKTPLVLLPTARSARAFRKITDEKCLVFSAFNLDRLVAFWGGEAPAAGNRHHEFHEITRFLKGLDPDMGAARLLARAETILNTLNTLDTYGITAQRLASYCRERGNGPEEDGPLGVLSDIYLHLEQVRKNRGFLSAAAALRRTLACFEHLPGPSARRLVPLVAGMPPGPHGLPPGLRDFLWRLLHDHDGWLVERQGHASFELPSFEPSFFEIPSSAAGEKAVEKKDTGGGPETTGLAAQPARPPRLREVVADTPWQEIRLTALAIKRALAQGHARIAVVSGERLFNHLLQGELARWGLVAQDSAGTPLAAQPCGRRLMHLLDLLAAPGPVTWAALLACPADPQEALAREAVDDSATNEDSGQGPTMEDSRRLRKRLWLEWLRTLPRHATGPAWLDLLGAASGPAGTAPLFLSADITALLTELLGGLEERLDQATLAALVQHALRTRVTLTPGHAGLFLLGPQEARLLDFDCLLIPRAVEGVWPRNASTPWLAPADLRALGLPDPAALADAAGRDLTALVAGGHREVIILRSLHDDGTPCAPSRFLRTLPLEADPELREMDLLEAASPEPNAARAAGASPAPPGLASLAFFTPKGPQYPRSWSASFVETLMACPYRAYAERILKLLPPDPLEPEPDARAGGLLVHTWLERAGRLFDHVDPANRPAVEAHLLTLAEALLHDEDPLVRALWRPRLRKLAPVLADRWLDDHRRVEALEKRVEKTLGGVTLHAKIDRVETAAPAKDAPENAADARVVLDFKTGTPPPWSDVADGVRPQLALEGWLLGNVTALEYWQLRGYGQTPLLVSARDAAPLLEPVEAGLLALTLAFAEGHDFKALPDMTGGGLIDSGHCATCALSDVCRKREARP